MSEQIEAVEVDVVEIPLAEFRKLQEMISGLSAGLQRMRESSAAQVAALNRVIELLTAAPAAS